MVRVAAVDFGTTSSVVAYVAGEGRAELVQHGTTTRVPSAVFWDQGHLLAGEAAVRSAARSPGSFEPTPKRQISAGEVVLPFEEPVRVVRAVAEVLRVATGDLASYRDVRWVATHPVAWGPDAMGVLADAFGEAGIEVAAWVAEPVAAAWRVVPVGERVVGGRYAVFDWGGGTFDAAVLRWDGDRFWVDAHDGDPRLGGEDIDDALLAHVLDRLPGELAGRLRSPSEPADLHVSRMLRRDVQDAKHALSRAVNAPLTVSDRVAGEQRLVVSREDLNELAAPFVERCVTVLSRCLLDAGVGVGDLAGVCVTGDASRLTLASTQVRDEFPGVALHFPVDAKGVVALGAADLVAAGLLPEDGPPAVAAGAGTGGADARAAVTASTVSTGSVARAPTVAIDPARVEATFASLPGTTRPVCRIVTSILQADLDGWRGQLHRFHLAPHVRVPFDVFDSTFAEAGRVVGDRGTTTLMGRAAFCVSTGPGTDSPMIGVTHTTSDAGGRAFAVLMFSEATASGPGPHDLVAATEPARSSLLSADAVLLAPGGSVTSEALDVEVTDANLGGQPVLSFEVRRNPALDGTDPTQAAIAGLGLAAGSEVRTVGHPQLGTFTAVAGKVTGARATIVSVCAVAAFGGGHLAVTVVRTVPRDNVFRKADPMAACLPFLDAVVPADGPGPPGQRDPTASDWLSGGHSPFRARRGTQMT